MKQAEQDWINHLRRALDDDVDELDPAVRQQLARSRARAVAQVRTRRHFLAAYAPGLSFATVAIAVVIVVGLQRPQSPDPALPDMLIELALIEADLELIEDLDFYHWLDANGYAG